MSSNLSQPFLPPEVILSIIELVVPTSNPQPIALPPSHPTTKTLLSLCCTSSITYPKARQLLYAHCLWIDSPARLQKLYSSLISSKEAESNTLRPRIRPEVPVLSHVTSLYLSHNDAPSLFPNLKFVDICALIAPYLRRLVIDLPLRDHHYFRDDDIDGFNDYADIVRATLRCAFSQLTALEVFCSVRDELYLYSNDGWPAHELEDTLSVWPSWPNLKMLALYNQDIGRSAFWPDLANLKFLETLILTRADGLEYVDMKTEWRKHCGGNKRGLDIVIVNVESDHRTLVGEAGWKEDNIKIRKHNVPTSYYGDENWIELCQEWVKKRLLRGENSAHWI